ncbi:MAG: glycosyltransferase family 2 protein [Spirochaetaceae bacterium]
MLDNRNLVTICIATYNREKSLRKCINSVINQTYKNLEIYIINDNSTDCTDEVVLEYVNSDKRIKYTKNKTNRKLAYNRNYVIKNGIGKYFTFIDDDDVWHEDFINNMVILCDKYSEQYSSFGGNIFKKGDSFVRITPPFFDGFLLDIIKKGFTPPVGSQFYNREMLSDLGGYNENIKSGVDHDLWFKLAANNKRVVTSQEAFSMPNISIDDDRMTTNYSDRLNKLTNSFSIWDNYFDDSSFLGFPRYIRTAYIFYMKERFFYNSLKSKEMKKVFFCLRGIQHSMKFYINLFYMVKNRFRYMFLINILRKSYVTTVMKPLFISYGRSYEK